MKKRQFIFLIAMCFCCVQLYSQTTTKYYDSSWHEVPKAQAFYHTDFIKAGDYYSSIAYRENSGKIYSTLNYADTAFKKHTGVEKIYYESGTLLDSIVFDEKGAYKLYDEFSENGKLKMHAFYDEKDHDMKGETYDSLGNKMPGFFTFQKQAMFPGGAKGWVAYLQKNLQPDVAARNGAPTGNYTVVVSFLIDQQRKISEVQAVNNPSYGIAEEAIRVIKNGPDWIPAVQNNKPVIYRQRQSFTFQVQYAK